MKKIDKNQILTVILGFAMLILSLTSVAFVCGGISAAIGGVKGAGLALKIVTGFLVIAPIVFFVFKLLEKDCAKLRMIATLTDLAIILVVFIFAIALAATKTEAMYAAELMGAEVLLIISWFILDFNEFLDFLAAHGIIISFKSNKVKETLNETVDNEPKEEIVEEQKDKTKIEEVSEDK